MFFSYFLVLVVDIYFLIFSFLFVFSFSCFLMFLGVAFKFFTAYNLSLLFHLVFCLLDFGLLVFRVCVLFFLNLISFVWVLDLVLDFLNSYVWTFYFLFLCVLKVFTAYGLWLLCWSFTCYFLGFNFLFLTYCVLILMF